MLPVLLVFQAVVFSIAFIAMWLASDKVINYAVQISNLFKLSKLFVGFIFIGLVTALPEIAVVLTSAFDGIPEMAAGNIIGANFNNLTLVLGLTAFWGNGLVVHKKEKRKLLWLIIIISLLFIFVFTSKQLSLFHSIFLILSYFATLLWMWKNKTISEQDLNSQVDDFNNYSIYDKIIVISKFMLSVFIVLIASELAVGRSEIISDMLNLSITTFGATIFSIVTTVPELALSINAIRKKEHGIALGTLIGSVLPHLCLCLSFLTVLSNKPVNLTKLVSFMYFIFPALFIIIISLWFKNKINRFNGFLLFILFIASFIYHLFF